jgi:hypothetical protein
MEQLTQFAPFLVVNLLLWSDHNRKKAKNEKNLKAFKSRR